jgi:hypothetical protein
MALRAYSFMKRQFRQWWSTIPSISTKRTITSHLNSLNTKPTSYDVGNPGPDFISSCSSNIATTCQYISFLTNFFLNHFLGKKLEWWDDKVDIFFVWLNLNFFDRWTVWKKKTYIYVHVVLIIYQYWCCFWD